MSASLPGSSAPLFVSPKMRAGAVDSSSTARLGDSLLLADAVLPGQVHAVLDQRQAVRDLREIAEPERLLLVVERAVVGGQHLQVVLRDGVPQERLVDRVAQRRRADVAGALETVQPGPRQVADVERQVLDAGLAHRVTPRARPAMISSAAPWQVTWTM